MLNKGIEVKLVNHAIVRRKDININDTAIIIEKFPGEDQYLLDKPLHGYIHWEGRYLEEVPKPITKFDMKLTNLDMTYCTKPVKSDLCKNCRRNYDLYEKPSEDEEKVIWMADFSLIPLENCSVFLKLEDK